MKKIICLITCVLCLFVCTSCKEKDEKTIIVGASSTPHAEILKECEKYILEKGYKLEIVEYTDYILPNVGVDDGSLDANFFQHLPYLNEYNEKNKTNIVSVLTVHYEPLGIYAGKSNSLENVKNGATIAIPNDTTNCARALALLQAQNLIKVNPDKGLLATVNDIIENKYNLTIKEIKAEQLPAQLPDFDYAVINGNYAINAKILNKLITIEDTKTDVVTTYANILCVNKGNENSEKTKLLVEAITQDSIKEYIKNTYGDSVIPAF